MTKHELKKILNRLDFFIKLDRKIQNAYDSWNKVIASGSHTPIIERGSTDGFIEGVCSSSQTAWLKEHLSYYTYELPGMKQSTGQIKNKKYNLKKRSEYINFVLDSR